MLYKIRSNDNNSYEVRLEKSKKKTKSYKDKTEKEKIFKVIQSVNIKEENHVIKADKDIKNIYHNNISLSDDSKNDNARLKCYFENCDKTFKTRRGLDRHYQSHLNNVFFKCDINTCDKTYKSKENLVLHQKTIHNGEFPYQCSFCLSKFSHRAGNLFIKI